ncbi:MAG: gamma-glutamyltransferase [Burkholderiales bacterium]|nr:gamma-glutamyltransferase [Burkholderiales bacterium]
MAREFPLSAGPHPRSEPAAYRSHRDRSTRPLVPGSIAGWTALHETYGTLPWSHCFRTIEYAENGFPHANWPPICSGPAF